MTWFLVITSAASQFPTRLLVILYHFNPRPCHFIRKCCCSVLDETFVEGEAHTLLAASSHSGSARPGCSTLSLILSSECFNVLSVTDLTTLFRLSLASGEVSISRVSIV